MRTEKQNVAPTGMITESLVELLKKGKQAGVLHDEELNQLLKDRSDDEVDTIYEQLTAANIRVVFNDGTDMASVESETLDSDELAVEYNLEDSVRLYLKEIGQIKLLSAEEEIALAKLVASGDQKAKDKLAEANLECMMVALIHWRKLVRFSVLPVSVSVRLKTKHSESCVTPAAQKRFVISTAKRRECIVMDSNDIIMIVLAEHIVDKISALCRTLVLLKKAHARIHISNMDVSTSNSTDTYESTIYWKPAMDDLQIAKETLLCELTHCSADDLRKRMADIIDMQHREFVAALMVVMMQEELTHYRIKTEPGKITVDLTLIDSMYSGPSIKQIMDQVARYYGIEASAIMGKDRNAAVPRKVAIFLIRKLTNHSLNDIAKELGRDQSMVLYALRKIDRDLQAGNDELKIAVREITKQLNELI